MDKKEKPRILVYLTHPTVLAVTGFRLRLLGMNAIEINTDKAMADAMAVALPDLVIIDLDLADDAGLRWIERLASDECTNHIPVMCLSTKGDLQDAEAAFKAGAREFLLIPYDPVLLEDKVDVLLHQSRLMAKEVSARTAVAAK